MDVLITLRETHDSYIGNIKMINKKIKEIVNIL